MPFKISEVAVAVTRIENLSGEAAKRREKTLRNMTQRLPFQPVGREGHADVYDASEVAGLRLVQVAADMGVGRSELHDLTLRLTSTDNLAAKASKNFRPTVAEDMVRRVKAGESFGLRIDRTLAGDVLYDFGHPSNPKVDQIFDSAGSSPDVIASLEIKASRLIYDLLTELAARE